MSDRDFSDLQQDLASTAASLKKTDDPTARRDLLLTMYRLLIEADSYLVEPLTLPSPSDGNISPVPDKSS
jgi:hypothetical protein